MLRLIGGLLILAFTIYTLIDCIQTPEDRVRGLPKLAWVFIILLFPAAGGGAWFFAGRPHTPRLGFGRSDRGGPRGPDDDPDFLRKL